MEAMTIKEFNKLGKRDFDNGAVMESIRVALREREAKPQADAVECEYQNGTTCNKGLGNLLNSNKEYAKRLLKKSKQPEQGGS